MIDMWNWEDWEAGDTCIWEDDGENEGPFVLTAVQHDTGYAYWDDGTQYGAMTRQSNLIRILKQGRELTKDDLASFERARLH